MSIWVVVIFVVLTIIGLVMVGIGMHEKIKHKDDNTPPGTTYEVLLYGGIAAAVIGIIGLIWSLISYSKSKKNPQKSSDMGSQGMMVPDVGSQGMYGPPQGQDYNIEMSSMSQGPSAPFAPPAPYCQLPDGRFFNLMNNTVMSQPSMPSNPFGMLSQSSSCNMNSLNLEEFMKAAKLLKELKDIING